MTSPTAPAPKPRRRRIAALTLIGMAVLLLAVLFLGRMWLARTALTQWLTSRGVENDVRIDGLTLSRLKGYVAAGPASARDFTVEDIDVRYRIADWRVWRPGGLEVASIELVRPVLRAKLNMAGKISFGSLDPIVDEVLSKPPQPDAPKPQIILRQATVRLDTPYGQGVVLGDARVEDGRLRRLSARLNPGTFNVGASRAEVRALRVEVTSVGDKADATVTADLGRLATQAATAEGVRLTLTAQGPYPDLDRKQASGALTASLNAAADRARWAGGSATAPKAAVTYAGKIDGWGQSLRLLGAGKAQLLADEANQGDITFAEADLRADAPALDIAPTQQRAAAQDLAIDVTLARLGAPDLSLTALSGRFAGKAQASNGAADAALTGNLAAKGAYTGLGRAQPGEIAILTQTRRALSDFTVRAPGLTLATASGGQVGLTSPVRLQSRSGATVTVAALGGAALYAQGGGAARIDVSGGGLLTADARVSRYRLTSTGVEAQTDLKATGDLALASGVTLAAGGTLRVAGARTDIILTRCGDLSIETIELGDNDVTTAKGRVCPAGRALVSLQNGAFRSQARLEGVQAALPALELRVENGAGVVSAVGGKSLNADLDLAGLRVIDTAAERRFNPVDASGDLQLAGDTLAGGLDVATPAGRKLAEVALTQTLSTGIGRAAIDTGELSFAQGTLQPADITPLAAVIGSPVTGQARFVGAVEWAGDALTTGGEVTVDKMDFKSPAGDVQGLAGAVILTSLAPLAAPPGQTLSVAGVSGPLPITGARAIFGIADEQLRIEAASAQVGGGTVSVGATNVPFDQTKTWETVLLVDGVQLSDIVEKSAFADKLQLNAKVTGRAPLTIGPQGVRVIQGQLAAVQAGRMSLKREALSQVSAGGGATNVPDAPPNLAADFAYQAMENLAFESLSVEMNSLPAGRLGLLFKIKGEHAPPQKQELRLGVTELIRQTFMNRSLTLPSGTKVDLTLDTSLNADELLSDVVNLRGGGGSPTVQPVQ